jgi:hypothetical protein
MMEKFLEHQIGIDEYITGNRFIDICEESGATFCKTDFMIHFTKKPINLFVTHNSDFHITPQIVRNYAPQTTCWLAQNKDIDSPGIHPIPIGLENMIRRTTPAAWGGQFSSEVPGALQKAELINRINSLGLAKPGDAYMNFNINTYPIERQEVWDRFSTQSWVTATQKLTLEQFYFDLASHKFVISPRGNGVDCHRTWEALYLRTIPIVKSSTHMNGFSDLPIYYVNNWEELEYNKLLDFYEKVKTELFDLSKMKISVWKEIICEHPELRG